jgi:YD repeat-containing protein
MSSSATASGQSQWSQTTDSPGTPTTLLNTITLDPLARSTTSAYDSFANTLSSTDALTNKTTASFEEATSGTSAGMDLQSCSGTAIANAGGTDCGGSDNGPAPINTGSTICPPSAPPAGLTYSQYDTDGNLIWTSTGISSGGTTTARTTYQLYNGDSVNLTSGTVSCSTNAPSPSLPCATINADGVVTQLAYDSAGDIASSSIPDGNAGGEVAKTSYTYDADGEKLTETAPDGNLSGANAANYTTSWSYNADGEVSSSTVGGGTCSTIVGRTTTATYDADGNALSLTRSATADAVGATFAQGGGSSLSLALPAGTRAGDEALLSTTVSAAPGASIITTLAGGGASGLKSNVAVNQGQLDQPMGTVVDSAGDVFVADQDNARVEEIPATSGTYFGVQMVAGNIYTIAGSEAGASGDSSGVEGVDALLDNPTALALDSQGNLYISDYANSDVLELACCRPA